MVHSAPILSSAPTGGSPLSSSGGCKLREGLPVNRIHRFVARVLVHPSGAPGAPGANGTPSTEDRLTDYDDDDAEAAERARRYNSSVSVLTLHD
jgi:hypothetical protein